MVHVLSYLAFTRNGLRTSDTIKVTTGGFARALGSFWYATELGPEMCGMVVYIFEGFGL